jgi:hypothetical protein
MTNKEFQIPYLFMLKQENEDKNNDYNYRLISNIFLNENNFNPKNDHYLYIFGLFPCKYMPSAYIPFNYKKLLQNINRINPKNIIKFEEIFKSDVKVQEELKKRIENFTNKDAIYNKINLSLFAIILIFYWSIILLLFNYVFLYYYRSVFNYMLAVILFGLLLFSIIWKMIYTIQN